MTRVPARLLEEAAACDWSDAPFARGRAVELAGEILDYLPRDTPGVMRARYAAVVLERAQPRPERWGGVSALGTLDLRERRTCPICQRLHCVAGGGRLWTHGPKTARCRGSGLTAEGARYAARDIRRAPRERGGT